MHIIDKKIIEDRIAFLKAQEQIFINMNTKSDNITADNIGLMISENESILSNIKELEVVDAEETLQNYLVANVKSIIHYSFPQYLTDNNYIIVKNPNK